MGYDFTSFKLALQPITTLRYVVHFYFYSLLLHKLIVKLKFSYLHTVLLLALFFFVNSYVQAQGFYSCIDKYGRKLGSDRPIPECADTIQKEHNAAGVVIRQRDGGQIRTTADNSASEANKVNKTEPSLDERKEKALLARYRNQELHNQERQRALAIVDANIASTQKKINELLTLKVNLEKEASKPADQQTQNLASIKRKISDNDQTLKILKTLLTDANSERQRTNQRFDEEQIILIKLWDTSIKK